MDEPVKKTVNNLPGAGPGRPKGVPNKINGALKEMILEALEASGGVDYLAKQAETNPTAFLSLIGKVLPMTLATDPNRPVQFEFLGQWLTKTIQDRNSE